jgi:putative oxidoreductase
MSQQTTATPASPTRTRQRAAHLGLWALQAVTAVATVAAGVTTLIGTGPVMAAFDAIGAGDWVRILTGILQVAGGLGLLIPRLAGLAALALTGLWLVAIATHLFLIGGNPAPAVVLLLLSAGLAWARRDRIRELLPSR